MKRQVKKQETVKTSETKFAAFLTTNVIGMGRRAIVILRQGFVLLRDLLCYDDLRNRVWEIWQAEQREVQLT